mmetsp:Transcript_20463/g.32000  ORF Transcript_20463/g.32000 Transcript_20463/m.32000 type:complete len:200 (-) Transcript_20463:1520-2119(-)
MAGGGDSSSIRSQPTVLLGVIFGLAISVLVLFFLFLSASEHMTMKSDCAPLEDPVLEHKIEDEGEEDERHYWRSYVDVEVVSHKTGSGRTLLEPDARVYNSPDGRWFEGEKGYLKEISWAASHCLCPGCNGTEGSGQCDICLPRTEGCDIDAPEYACYLDVRNREAGWPIYDAGIGRVRFRKNLVRNVARPPLGHYQEF